MDWGKYKYFKVNYSYIPPSGVKKFLGIRKNGSVGFFATDEMHARSFFRFPADLEPKITSIVSEDK